jgi:hypothetical protein
VFPGVVRSMVDALVGSFDDTGPLPDPHAWRLSLLVSVPDAVPQVDVKGVTFPFTHELGVRSMEDGGLSASPPTMRSSTPGVGVNSRVQLGGADVGRNRGAVSKQPPLRVHFASSQGTVLMSILIQIAGVVVWLVPLSLVVGKNVVVLFVLIEEHRKGEVASRRR